jgi:hypothetical protein
VLTLLGFASVTVITLAINDLYARQHRTDVELCAIVAAEWDQILRLGLATGLDMPPAPPACSISP